MRTGTRIARDLRERSRAATRRSATPGTGAGSRAAERRCASPVGPALRGLIARHGLVGYGSCSRLCPTSPRGAMPPSSRRSSARSRRHARVLDVHADPDHHRAVFTLAGDPGALTDALLAGISAAIALIDLRTHSGVHPEGRGRRRRAAAFRSHTTTWSSRSRPHGASLIGSARSSGCRFSSTARSEVGRDLRIFGAAGSKSWAARRDRRARPRRRSSQRRSEVGSGARGRSASAHRLQRRPRDRQCRRRSRDRCGRARVRRRNARRAGDRASTFRAPDGSRSA